MIRVVDAGDVSGIRSQTIYHGLAKLFTPSSYDTVVLARPVDPYFCVGYFQDARQELDIDYCRENGIPIVRRETGGGTVFIDRHQLFVQWIFHKSSLPAPVDERYKMFIQPIVRTYRHLGINAYYYPVNDIHVDGKKIAGLGGAQIGNAMVVTGNFLLDFDYATMLAGLNILDRDMRELSKSEMYRYLTTASKELGAVPDMKWLKECYIENCVATVGKSPFFDDFKPEEIDLFERLDAKMYSDEWLFKIKKTRGEDAKMLKIHSGVWLGYIDYFGRRVRFRMHFDKLSGLELNKEGKTVAVTAFDGMKLAEQDIKGYVRRSMQAALIEGLGREDWTEILKKIVQYRQRHG